MAATMTEMNSATDCNVESIQEQFSRLAGIQISSRVVKCIERQIRRQVQAMVRAHKREIKLTKWAVAKLPKRLHPLRDAMTIVMGAVPTNLEVRIENERINQEKRDERTQLRRELRAMLKMFLYEAPRRTRRPTSPQSRAAAKEAAQLRREAKALLKCFLYVAEPKAPRKPRTKTTKPAAEPKAETPKKTSKKVSAPATTGPKAKAPRKPRAAKPAAEPKPPKKRPGLNLKPKPAKPTEVQLPFVKVVYELVCREVSHEISAEEEVCVPEPQTPTTDARVCCNISFDSATVYTSMASDISVNVQHNISTEAVGKSDF